MVPTLEIWGLGGTSSLPLLPDPLWFGEVLPGKVQSMNQIDGWLVDMLGFMACQPL